jgi:vesicular inhibitory amino acid transporter
MALSSSMNGMSGLNRGLLKVSLRIVTIIVFVVISILFPEFDRIMTLLGSVACFSICIILPLAFHLKLFGKEIGRGEKIMNWSLIVVSTILAVISTGFACVPKELIGA